MITFNVHADNTTVTEAIRAYIDAKLGVLSKYKEVNGATAKVNIKVYPDKNTKIEVTIKNFHAEDRNRDLYAAIDLVIEKLDKQLRRAKTQRLNFRQNRSALKQQFVEDIDDTDVDE